MKRKYYILLLLLLSVDCWYLKPFGNFFASGLGFVAYLFALFVGTVYYYHTNKYPTFLLKQKYYKPIIWIFIAVLLSFIPAYINYGQSFARSIIASRVMLIYMTLPVLLIARPTYKDIRWALYVFSAMFLCVAVLDSFLRLPIITPIEGETVITGRDYIAKGDYIHFIEGVHYIGIAFIISLSRLREHFSFKKLYIVLFLIGIIFLTQNRSTLFPCAAFFVFTLFSIKQKKYRGIIRVILFITIVLLLVYTVRDWNTLFKETSTQLNDKGYNRNLAIFYFIFDACPHWWEYILGNGFISAKSTSLMQDMMEQGVFNSDVGFIGLWNQFGIIPVIVFLIIIVKTVMHKNYTFLLKCNAWFILACSLTTAYFGQNCKILWACLFLYMCASESFLSNRRLIKISRPRRDKIYGQLISAENQNNNDL